MGNPACTGQKNEVSSGGGDLELAGPIETTEFQEGQMGRIRIRPDAREIVFNAEWPSAGSSKIWVMENFLPTSDETD